MSFFKQFVVIFLSCMIFTSFSSSAEILEKKKFSTKRIDDIKYFAIMLSKHTTEASAYSEVEKLSRIGMNVTSLPTRTPGFKRVVFFLNVGSKKEMEARNKFINGEVVQISKNAALVIVHKMFGKSASLQLKNNSKVDVKLKKIYSKENVAVSPVIKFHDKSFHVQNDLNEMQLVIRKKNNDDLFLVKSSLDGLFKVDRIKHQMIPSGAD